MRARRAGGDAGQVAGIEAVPFGLLVLAVGVLLVAHTWAVVDAKFLTTAAAREATRAYVEAPSEPAGDAEARRVAQDVTGRSGRPPASLRLVRTTTGFGRCAPTRFRAELQVPTVVVPWRPDRGALTVGSVHAEVVDPFRDGLPGVAECVVPP